jgi:homoserine dehydrogenase
VALLGCGTVGGGVLRHLLARPERYAVVGVAVRDLARRLAPAAETGCAEEIPRALLCDGEELLSRPADVLVEAAGGLAVAPWIAAALVAPWIAAALAAGRHVVTANKTLLAERGVALAALARARGVRLLGSAAVGGALPALETVARLRRRAPVVALRGVLNGTSSFVLDRLAHGEDLEAAIAEARRRGFAEADPSADLDGSDAAQKLSLLLAAAGHDLPWTAVRRGGVDEEAAAAARRGGVWRLVARAGVGADGTAAAIRVEEVAPRDLLATPGEASCALEATLANGEVVRLAAQGAGRWPTAEAVLADLEDLRLEPVAHKSDEPIAIFAQAMVRGDALEVAP